ncbi:Sjogren's syndrome/scleroderma autoantigen 1 family protein [Natronolimnohabitans innermongolicus]|nr:Sjogren's syndrome/scleroderma autoantigen 1 family protein [Natronolimnohabitans innermongolicus]
MSDFDKEAEREKLREKYERDKQERQATQRMSDLLLKGATMTNAHCGTCGDPLFQLDGTTFCPSCHGNPDAVEGTELEADATGDPGQGTDAEQRGDAEPEDGDQQPPETAADSQSPADAADVADAAGTSGKANSNAASSSTTDDPVTLGSSSQSTDERDASPTSTPRSAASGADSTPSRDAPNGDRRSAGRSAGGDLGTARDSLVAAVEKFAAEAAETDDPRYARECLEAAREASEALETLR